jgi:catechol 2,3-dioxygenase-like lactoylglutathione lyase family enzyme
MGIHGIASVTYAVEDVPLCTRFFTDFGLERQEVSDTGATLTTLQGQEVRLRPLGDSSLPAGPEEGPTVREVVWGVDSADDLQRLGTALAVDRDVREDDDGSLHTTDLSGFGIGLAVGVKQSVPGTERRRNSGPDVQRWNDAVDAYGRARPLRISHIALDIAKDGREAATDFYLERLGFRATDRVLQVGTFLQAASDDEHHNLLLCHRPDRPGINHTSYEVRDFDEVMEGGNHMIAQGWREARRIGRHTIGSNVFRFFHAPCGGRVEYAADMDRVDARRETRVHEVTPPHHIWTLRSNRDDVDA